MFKKSPSHVSYEEKVLSRLEQFSLNKDGKMQTEDHQFASVIDGLEEVSTRLANSIAEQSERNRIQVQAQHEKLAKGISETNYNLINIGCGIAGLEKSMRQSSSEIARQIATSGSNVVDKLEESSRKLHSIDNQLKQTVSALNQISDQLHTIIEKISKPNEVEAIELADQARINLAIGKQDEALRVTRKAIELCGTSVTVTAYHLMTLALFNDEEHQHELKNVYNDFINLIGFLLVDRPATVQFVREEVFYLVYPVVYALCRSLGIEILKDTERLFLNISQDKEIYIRLLKKPLVDEKTEALTLYPTAVRELIWSVILKEGIVKYSGVSLLPIYIYKVEKNSILIKNELLIIANQLLVEMGVLYELLSKEWNNQKLSPIEKDSIDVFLMMQPQENIDYSEKLLLLIDRYIKQGHFLISESFEIIINSAMQKITLNIEQQYLNLYYNKCNALDNEEREMLCVLKRKLKEYHEAKAKKEAGLLEKRKEIQHDVFTQKQKISDANNYLDHLIRQEKKFKKTIPVWVIVFPSILIGFAMAAVLNFDKFGGFNFFVGIIASLSIGRVISKKILDFVHEKRERSAMLARGEIKKVEKDKQEYELKLVSFDMMLKDLDNVLPEFSKDACQQLVNMTRNDIMKKTNQHVDKLENQYNELIDCYYPAQHDIQKVISDFNPLIHDKLPEKLCLSNFFIKELKMILSEVLPSNGNFKSWEEQGLFNEISNV
ncbi:hypothetical protein [Aliikangiella sp. IMCC44359]|uniref:hypothetical protein n=1 Tax=Aliikangiella sp. IMCC44359 TaxID=3459125 RepID=UPI00403ACF13